MFSTAFSIAGSGLRTMQAVVDTGTKNIANADTPGYRRRDEALSEMLAGGVTSTTLHRFNEATAARLVQLSAEVGYQDTLAASLQRIQSQLSDASTQAAQALDALRQAVGAMSTAPGNLQAREVVVQKASSLASAANAHLVELERHAAQLDAEGVSAAQSAKSILEQMHELNRAVLRHGALPELRDGLAQQAVELAELTGAQLRFNANGTAVVSIRETPVLDGDVRSELPAVMGGKVAALADAAANARTNLQDMRSALGNFASQMNEANRRGVDASGAAGGDIFEVGPQGLAFVGSAQRLAFSDASPLDGHNVRSFLDIDGLSQDLGAIAARTANQALSARGLAGVHASVLQSAQERQRREEGVDIDFEIARVKQAQRLYEANAKLIQVADSMLGTLLSIKA